MWRNPPLADAEIAKKFGVEIGTLEFEGAKLLSLSRPDRTISKWPIIMCPHCEHEEITMDWRYIIVRDAVVCVSCERLIYVEAKHGGAITLTTEDTSCA